MAQASRSKWFKDCGWALLVVLLLGLSAVLGRPGTAAAQQQALVSNLSQNDFATPSPIASALGIVDHAQQFTTGSNAGGYKLNSVDIEFSQFDTGLSFSVSVYNSSEGKPGTLVGNLSTPTFSSFTSDTVLTFSASGDGIALAASTAYFVVLDVSGDRGSRIATWRVTTSMSEDSGAAAGWSIADKHLFRANTDNADWRDNLIRSSLKIRVNGSLVTLPTVTVASVASPVTEGDPARFTVSRTGATTSALAVQLTVAEDNDDGQDFVASTGEGAKNFTIPSGSASSVFSVTTTADTIDEPAGEVTVTVTDSDDYTVGGASSAVVVVNDDDAAPTAVTLSADADTGTGGVQTTVTENGGAKTVRVTATVDGTTRFGASKTIAVQVGGSDDTAVEGTDYSTVANQMITIAPGANSGFVDFALTPTNDSLAEPQQSLSIEGTLAGVTVAGTSVAITDDETAPPIVLSVAPTTAGESDGAVTVTVTATVDHATVRFDPARVVTVSVEDSDTDGVVGFAAVADFDVTIGSGEASGTETFTLTPTANSIDEEDETITVSGASTGPPAAASVTSATLTLTDDDDAGVTVSATARTVAENSGSATYTVVLTSQPTHDVTVTVASDDDSVVLVDGDDAGTVGSASETLTFTASGAKAWNVAQTVTVSGVNDDFANTDGERSATVTHTVASTDQKYDDFSPVGSVDVTVTDDDETPEIDLSVNRVSIAENAPAADTQVTVTATVQGTARFDTAKTVRVTVAGPEGDEFVDFTPPAAFDVTIAAGAATSAGSFVLAPVDDQVKETDATVTVGGTSAGVTVNPASLMLTDDEADPIVALSAPLNSSITEGAQAEFALVATVASSKPLTLNVTVAETGGGDHVAADAEGSQTVTLPAYQTRVAYAVSTTDDSVAEPGTTIGLTLRSGTGYRVAVSNSRSVTVADDDTPTATDVTLTASSASVAEGGNLTVTATLTAAAASAVTIPITAVNGSAVAGDYTAPAGVTVSAGKSVGTATFSAADDAIDEPSETLTLRLGALPSGYAAGAPASVSVIIIDGDATTVTLAREAGATLTEGESIVHTLTLGRALAAGESLSVPLMFNIGTGAATRGADYTLACPDPLPTGVACNNLNSGDATVVFTGGAAAARTVAITLTATADSTAEPGGETVDVGVGSLAASTLDGGATASDDAAAFTVEDAPAVTDTAVTVGVNNGSVTEGATLTVTVTLASVAPGDVVIPITAVNGTAGSGDYRLSAAGVAITGGQSSGTVTLTAVDDDAEEGAETLSIRLGTLPDGYAAGTPSSVSVTINDPASTVAPAVTVIQTGGGTVVAENSGTDTYTITLAAEPSTNVSVAVISSTPTAARVDGPDPAIAPTASETLTFTPDDYDRPQTITVTGVDDSIDNPGNRRTVVITHSITAASAAEYRSIVISSVIVIVTDDDSPPLVTTITPPPAQAPEPPPALDPEPESEPDPEPAPVFEDLDDTTDTHRGSVAELTGDGTLDGIGCDDDRLCPKQPIMTWEFAVVLLRRIDNQQAPENAQTPDDQAEPGENAQTPDDQAELGDAEGSEGGEPDGDSETADPGGGSGASDENGGTPDSETLDAWWAPYLERLVELGVVTDCDDNADTADDDNCVGDVLTRAQAARLIAIVYNLPDATPAGFEDTADSPHAAAIDALHAAGITIGCTSDPLNYCPDQPISRQEAASMITRATRHLNSKA
ncbi:MAG: hypothetical protein OXD37_09940 [Acidimicrobiaceae bacterium]|nr:hypothetical protein [Acidimicrobiaceae bacterium]